MSFLPRLLITGACVAMMGCQRPPPAAKTASAEPSTRASTQPAESQGVAPATTEGGVIAHRCDDGSTFDASYGDSNVTLRWPDGRSVTLPRAESASEGGGDIYVGDTVSLQREGGRIELHDGDAPTATCIESAD